MLKLTNVNIWLYDILNNFVYKTYDLYFNRIVQKQLRDLKNIPVVIINFNQFFYLKKLINFLLDRNFTNIVIIDNKSTYSPLLRYYEEIESKVKVELMKENYGHLVFFENKELQKKYGKGFYIISDADVVPNENVPEDFLEQFFLHLRKHWRTITKVGFALRIDDIPEQNQLKKKILDWEEKFWKNKVEENIYDAPLDTTFALYKPGYPQKYNQIQCFSAHRFAGDFTGKHGGWYIDQNNLTEEQYFYINSASTSSSWLQDEKNVD